MKRGLRAFVWLVLIVAAVVGRADSAFRPPAVPLVTHDPYLSIWSEADRLTDDTTRHWTHHPHPLGSLIHIDGVAYRLMGNEPRETPAFPQVSLQVLPTRSIYDFDNAHVHVTMTFMTPALPDDLDVLTRPLSYITWSVRSVDGAPHAVSLYDSVSSLLAVNQPEQAVGLKFVPSDKLTVLRAGTDAQPVLQTMGDDTRIDWGYAYLAAPTAQLTKGAIGPNRSLMDAFAAARDSATQDLASLSTGQPGDPHPAMVMTFDLGRVGAQPVERHVIVAYDEIYAIKYFGRKLRPFWRRNGATALTMLQAAERDYPKLTQRCEAFDRDLMADLTRAGGPRYAQMCALVYRQFLAACGIAADANKQPLLFTKENTSNGDIATVDVIFPMAPALILLSPTLAKASIVPILAYSASPHWKFPNAPHDLGTYPNAFGRDDGGEGMPVEESGNMLILCDAISKAEGNPSFVAPWWPQLTQWAQYLERYGLDPENQLCTDDFMGHLAHNANLSIKAILGLAAYGDLCRMRGDSRNADRYMNLAKADAAHWIQAADDGNHSRLAFDKPGTWSQKYNLVWDRILGLDVFPPSVAQREVAFYKTVMQPYGVPLDSRTHLTKTDWSFWSATLAANQADFEALLSPVYDYLNQTTSRQPLVDSYVTDDIHSSGMHARPVVGGLFIKMLAGSAWKKWASRDRMRVGPWAPLPEAPRVTQVVPTAQAAPVIWRYTFEMPAADWAKPDFDDSGWKQGPAGFGTAGTPGAVVRTTWSTGDIWLRRTFTMPAVSDRDLQLSVYHDEDVRIFINGVPAASESEFTTAYTLLDIAPQARALLKPGAKITLAVHCHQTTGGQGVDVGLVRVAEPRER